MPFDALGYAQKRQEAGVPREHATAQASYLRDAFVEQERTLATKIDLAELRVDFGGLRGELRADFAELRADFEGLRGELRADFEGLRSEVRTEIQSVRTEMATLRADLREEMYAMDTRISRDIGDLKGAVGQIQGELQTIRRLFWAVVIIAFGLLFKEVITGTIVKLAGA